MTLLEELRESLRCTLNHMAYWRNDKVHPNWEKEHDAAVAVLAKADADAVDPVNVEIQRMTRERYGHEEVVHSISGDNF